MKNIIILFFILSITSCFSSKEDAKISRVATINKSDGKQVKIKEVWSIGNSSLEDAITVGLNIATTNTQIFVANGNTVYAYDKNSGRKIWEKDIIAKYTPKKRYKEETSFVASLFVKDNYGDEGNYDVQITAGPIADSQIVVIGGSRGEVVMLDTNNGNRLAIAYLDSPILANPHIYYDQILIKTEDSYVRSLDRKDLSLRWNYSQIPSGFNIKGSSSIVTNNDKIFVGFDNGKLVALNNTGVTEWLRRIGIPKGRNSLSRMVDVDSPAIVDGDNIYSVSFQGRAMSLDVDSGKVNWIREMSSILGGDVIGNILFFVDSETNIRALSKKSGSDIWSQEGLRNRITAPPIVDNNLIIVGDFEGYIHWIDSKSGNILFRARVSKDKIIKLVKIDDMIAALDIEGDLYLFRKL